MLIWSNNMRKRGRETTLHVTIILPSDWLVSGGQCCEWRKGIRDGLSGKVRETGNQSKHQWREWARKKKGTLQSWVNMRQHCIMWQAPLQLYKQHSLGVWALCPIGTGCPIGAVFPMTCRHDNSCSNRWKGEWPVMSNPTKYENCTLMYTIYCTLMYTNVY